MEPAPNANINHQNSNVLIEDESYRFLDKMGTVSNSLTNIGLNMPIDLIIYGNFKLCTNK